MKIDLAGKKALIGGSSKGIGLGIASQLAESGACVCLMARNESKLKEIINQLPNSENHSYLIVDFSNFEEYKIKIEAYLENNKSKASWYESISLDNEFPAGGPCVLLTKIST